MKDLILKFANCQTSAEVDKLVEENFDMMDDCPSLFNFARNAKKRIRVIEREKMKSWKTQLN